MDLEKMRQKVRADDEKLQIMDKLSKFEDGMVVDEYCSEWSYLDSSPYIRVGSIYAHTETDAEEKIKIVKQLTKGLITGTVGGYSSCDDSSDWAELKVRLEDTSDKTLRATVKKLRKYCPALKVKFKRVTEIDL